jgi:hypothetical protein
MGIKAETLSQVVSGERGSLKERLFGRFFQDIDGCFEVMRTQSAIASGSAVLHALLPSPSWEAKHIDIFVDVQENRDWSYSWIEYMRSQGYAMVGQRKVLYGEVAVGFLCDIQES